MIKEEEVLYKKYNYLHYIGIILLILFPAYMIYDGLSQRFQYRDEFLIPLRNGCYYGEGTNLPTINLSAPLEAQGNFSMGHEPVTRCWTMADYNLNASAIDMKIEEINSNPKRLLIPVSLMPLINAIAIFLLHKYLKKKKDRDVNGGEEERSGES